MALQISRLYDFQPGSKILSSQVDAELDQLVLKHNQLDAALDSYKTLLASVTGAANIGITPVTGIPASVTTLQGFILEEVTARKTHEANVANPHSVTKAQVGLGNLTNDKQATSVQHTTHIENVSNPHSVTKAQVGLSNLTNDKQATKAEFDLLVSTVNTKVDKEAGKTLVSTTMVSKVDGIQEGAEVNVQSDWTEANPQSDAFIKNKPVLGTSALKNVGTNPGNIPVLDGGGKLEISVLPTLAITKTSVVSSQAEMLALVAEEGDVAIRTDLNRSFILGAGLASSMSNWHELLTPTDVVLSVCGKFGAVNLTAADVGALSPNDIVNILTSTETGKALSAAQGKALSDLIGSLSSLHGILLGKTSVMEAINVLSDRVGHQDFDNYFGGLVTLVGAVNWLARDKVTGVNVMKIKAEDGKLWYTIDNNGWIDCTGPMGPQGKGYNPRGAWVSGGSYVNDSSTIDTVEHAGSSYYCKLSVTGTSSPPNDPNHWGLMALSGTAAIGSQVKLTGYVRPTDYVGPVAETDSINDAIGKLDLVVDLNYEEYSDGFELLYRWSDEKLLNGMVINLPPVTYSVNKANNYKRYSFTIPKKMLVTNRFDSVDFLSNAIMDLNIDASPTSAYKAMLPSMGLNATVSLVATQDTLEERYYTLTGVITLVWSFPKSQSVEITVTPRLIIPLTAGTMDSFI